MSSQKPIAKDGRLHLRIDGDLEVAMKRYARRHGTTLTDIVTRHFVTLLQAESDAKLEVEQV